LKEISDRRRTLNRENRDIEKELQAISKRRSTTNVLYCDFAALICCHTTADELEGLRALLQSEMNATNTLKTSVAALSAENLELDGKYGLIEAVML